MQKFNGLQFKYFGFPTAGTQELALLLPFFHQQLVKFG